ncbi:unnamed protein product [Closterium sp. NIES-54]
MTVVTVVHCDSRDGVSLFDHTSGVSTAPAATADSTIFDLDFDAILAAMYALTDSAESDCYLRVPPNPGIEAAALGASASAAPSTGESAAKGTGESAAPGAGELAL